MCVCLNSHPCMVCEHMFQFYNTTQLMTLYTAIRSVVLSSVLCCLLSPPSVLVASRIIAVGLWDGGGRCYGEPK